VIKNNLAPQSVKLFRGSIEVTVKNTSSKVVQELLYIWYRTQAREIFTQRLQLLLSQTLWVSEQPRIRLLNMKTQWGNCSPNGQFTLNPNLVKASKECIDYVLLHELCHIAEHNHSEKFYQLISQIMPKWMSIKKRLDNMAELLLC